MTVFKKVVQEQFYSSNKLQIFAWKNLYNYTNATYTVYSV